MTVRTESGARAPYSLPALPADPAPGLSHRATPASTLETDMNLIPEQMARSHLESRRREAEQWRLRRMAQAVRRAEAAERRARLAREAAVLAVRESVVLASH